MSGRVAISKALLKRPKRGRPIKIRLPIAKSPIAGIPPSASSHTPDAPASEALIPAPAAKPVPAWAKMPSNSKVRKTAMRILALRLHGMADDDIAKAVGLSNAGTVRSYIYKAGKNGWLSEEIVNPKDAIEFDLMHKVVRNMSEALDSPDEERRDKMTVKVAEGTIFKTFDADAAAKAPPLTAIMVNVQMPEGIVPQVREGAVVGKPSYVDGEVIRGNDEPR